MSAKSAILLVVAVFAVTLLVRLPAEALSWLLPRSVACESPGGTLWHGGCAEIRSGALALDDVHWTLHPLSLLRAQAALDVDSNDPRARGTAQLTLHLNGDLDIATLNASLPLEGGIVPVPAGWSGVLDLGIDQASVRGGHIAALQGTLTARSLQMEHAGADLGSFELKFPAASVGDAPMLGTVRDLGGPLSLAGQLQLRRDGSYELDGSIAPRDDSSAEVQRALNLLGPPDASGRRPVSFAGTY
jgi:Type II secretion system (T2SS), protein N